VRTVKIKNSFAVGLVCIVPGHTCRPRMHARCGKLCGMFYEEQLANWTGAFLVHMVRVVVLVTCMSAVRESLAYAACCASGVILREALRRAERRWIGRSTQIQLLCVIVQRFGRASPHSRVTIDK
jgi:hypothetical protein